MTRVKALAVLVLGLVHRPAQAAEHQIEVLNPPRTTFSFAQTGDGFLFIGSLGDVQRYDGVNLVSVRTGSAIGPHNPWALRLAATRAGTVFMGLGGGLIRFRKNAPFEFEVRSYGGLQTYRGGVWSQVTGLPNDMVWALAAAREGGLWVGTEEGLLRLDEAGRVIQVFAHAQGLTTPFVLTLHEVDDEVWIGTTAGLFRLRDERVTATPIVEPVTAIAGDARRLWVGTPFGLLRLESRTGQGERPQRVAMPEAVTEVNALLQNRDGDLFAGTTRGLLRLPASADTDRPPTAHDWHVITLFDERVIALFEDADGQIWVGCRAGGVTKLAPRRVWTFGPDEGLTGQPTAVLRTRAGPLYVATEAGLHRHTGDRFQSTPVTFSRDGEIASSLAEDDDGYLWWATNSGIVRWHPARDAAPATVIAQAARALASAGRTLWVGWRGGGLSRLERDGDALRERHRLTVTDGLCPGELTSIAITRGGELWAAAPGGGVVRLDGDGRATCFGTGQGLSSLNVATVAVDDQDRVWVGALDDEGIYLHDRGRFHNLRGHDGLSCDSVHEIAFAHDQGMWLACGAGVTWIRRDRAAAEAIRPQPRVASVGTTLIDGLVASQTVDGSHPAAVVDEEGALWVASRAGLSRILPTPATAPRAYPPTLLSVRLDGQEQWRPPWPHAGVTVASARATLDVEFTASSLTSPARIAFMVDLEGHTMAPRFLFEHPRRLRFADLLPGRYRLRIASSDGRGGWHPAPLTLPIHVDTPLWRRWWLWIAGTGTVLALFFALHRLRLRHLSRRYAAVQAERARIARELHDSLGQSFAALTLHMDAATRLSSKDNQRQGEVLAQARAIAAHAREDMRQAIWELRAHGLEAPPLDTALAALVARLRQSDGPSLTVQAETRDLPRSSFVEFEILRIAEEAISNAIKHGEAERIDIRWSGDGESCVLEVSDDGRGIPEDIASLSSAGHFGIVGLHERAQRLGASLQVERLGRHERGPGTRVRLTVPLSCWRSGRDA